MTIAFVSATRALTLDPDLPLLKAAAERHGVSAEVVVWDDPHVDWSAYEIAVVRSCWDYTPRRAEFLSWAASIPHLQNPAPVLAWNTDKTYLRQLAAAGLPVIETYWDVEPGDPIGDHLEWVVKPTISAGSRDTARWSSPAEVYEHSVALLAAGRPSMTQPYIASVDDEGETALLYVNGTFSHAIRKGPLLAPGEGVRQDRNSRDEITARIPSEAQRTLADAVISTTSDLLHLSDPPLYARVDLVTATDGTPLLIELELTEPSMFLPQSDGGADRFLAGIVSRL